MRQNLIASNRINGFPTIDVVVSAEVGSPYSIYRLTDDGLSFYQEGPDFRTGIMSVLIKGNPAVEKVTTCKTRAEAEEYVAQLPADEKGRMLIYPD